VTRRRFPTLFLPWILLLVVVFIPVPGRAQSANYNGYPVSRVVVLGNQKVAKKAILDRMKTKPGTIFSDVQLDDDLKSIYALGFFDNILMNLTLSGGKVEVAVVVVEKPSVASIVIKGNNKIKRKDLLKEITVRTFSILSADKIAESEEEIRAFYRDKGFFSIMVKTKIKPTTKNRVKVIFTISEGRKSYIKKIRFHGNDHFSAWRLRGSRPVKILYREAPQVGTVTNWLRNNTPSPASRSRWGVCIRVSP